MTAATQSTLPPPERRRTPPPVVLALDPLWTVAYHSQDSDPRCPCCAAILPFYDEHRRDELIRGHTHAVCADCGLTATIERT